MLTISHVNRIIGLNKIAAITRKIKATIKKTVQTIGMPIKILKGKPISIL